MKPSTRGDEPEITLNTSAEETAVCNLGSIVLDRHLSADGSLDHEALRATVRVAVRALDNVIDVNFYPTAGARRANLRHRPVGLGVMGLQYALYMRGLAFAPRRRSSSTTRSMEAIAFYAYEASSDLAAERGSYRVVRGLEVGSRAAPAGHGRLLEGERGESVDVPRGGRLDWEPLRARIRAQGMRNSNCCDRADGDDREHHRHVALHRADVQEPVRQVEPVGRLHRAESVPGARPQSRGPVGRRVAEGSSTSTAT